MLLISTVLNIPVCPNIYLFPQVAVAQWERDPDRYFWLDLGAFSGLFLGALSLLVDDGVLLGMALGGFGAGLELLILLFLEPLQPVHFC